MSSLLLSGNYDSQLVGFIADINGLRVTYFIGAIIGLTAIPFISLLPKEK